jgi:glycosyltransferase involved in cell wall biosynthesis
VFIFPFLYEGFGLPIIEAFACETPVVAIRTPSVEEIIEKLVFLLKNKNDSERMAKNARIYAQRKFNPKLNIANYKRLFGDLIEH